MQSSNRWIGKSHLAKEVDALGGYMCEATDLSGIQFKTLTKKRPGSSSDKSTNGQRAL